MGGIAARTAHGIPLGLAALTLGCRPPAGAFTGTIDAMSQTPAFMTETYVFGHGRLLVRLRSQPPGVAPDPRAAPDLLFAFDDEARRVCVKWWEGPEHRPVVKVRSYDAWSDDADRASPYKALFPGTTTFAVRDHGPFVVTGRRAVIAGRPCAERLAQSPSRVAGACIDDALYFDFSGPRTRIGLPLLGLPSHPPGPTLALEIMSRVGPPRLAAVVTRIDPRPVDDAELDACPTR